MAEMAEMAETDEIAAMRESVTRARGLTRAVSSAGLELEIQGPRDGYARPGVESGRGWTRLVTLTASFVGFGWA